MPQRRCRSCSHHQTHLQGPRLRNPSPAPYLPRWRSGQTPNPGKPLSSPARPDRNDSTQAPRWGHARVHSLENREDLSARTCRCHFGHAQEPRAEDVLASRPCRERSLVIAGRSSRIIQPASKLATARALEEETATTSLGIELDGDAVTETELRGALTGSSAKHASRPRLRRNISRWNARLV